ncbi:hypothetical protein QEG73_21940 [Chitinophagaceae bacterium 26-R-25]|nr:hypothetical protein [Chitinophagaceae bacterium 26-R-25]
MAFPKVLTVANAEAFTVVAAGDTVNEAGFLLSEEHVNALEQNITDSENSASEAQTQIGNLTQQLAAANTARETAEQAASTLQTQVDTLTADLATANQLVEEYGGKTKSGQQTVVGEDKNKTHATKKDSFDSYAEDLGVGRY